MQLLESLPEDEDTVLIFTADNGYHWGEHRVWGGKGRTYEESLRVPLIARYPRMIQPGGENVSHMVLNIDLAPTLVELAGTVPDGPVDGQSIVPLLFGEAVTGWRQDFLIEQYGGLLPNVPDIYQGVRIGSGIYAYYLNTGEEELYDLSADPHQMESRANDPVYALMRLYCQFRMQDVVTNAAFRIDFD